MTFRRHIFIIACFLMATGAVYPDAVLHAAPPQFNPNPIIRSNIFSPFPGDEPQFIISITPTEYIPLVSIGQPQKYTMEYDYPDYAITYQRVIKKDVEMIPVTADFDSYVRRRVETSVANTSLDIRKQSLAKDQKSKAGGLFSISIPIRSRAFETIFGEGGASLRVSGYRRISFTGRSTWTDKQQTATSKQSKFPSLEMEQIYRFDIEGTIGSKISVKVSQDSRNDLPLANRLILRYRGAEDDVLQTVEAGNTTLNLPSTQFLAYSTQVQGLFGIKATAQVADVSITAIASQEKGSTETVEISAGSSTMASKIIKDINYRKNIIFDLGRKPLVRARTDTLPEPDKYDFLPGDTISYMQVYLDDNTTIQADRMIRTPAFCYIDPDDTLSDDPKGEYKTLGYFDIADAADYYINTTEHYLQFLRSSAVKSNGLIAVYMEVIKHRDGQRFIDTVGDISSPDTLRLKLIKPQSHTRVNHHIWEYEWRNVYSLGTTEIDPREVEVNIFKGSPINNKANADDLDDQDGVKYLQVLGLDQGDDKGSGAADGELDRGVYVDGVLGLLIFPTRHPFSSDISYVNDQNNAPIVLKDSVPELYLTTNQSVINSSSKYYITVTTKSGGVSSVINLNAANIIRESEVIKDGDYRLVKGVDYNIDYDFGRITLLNDEHTGPNSNLSITYENAPFFSLAKKTLLGTRLQYVPGRDFKLGATLLYKSDKSTNRKPKVGEETSRMFVWDTDFSYRFKNNLFTKMIDALPLISTQTESFMQVAGELAQSRPNPNVDGQVYIDDFEGSKDSYPLGIYRSTWRLASRPAVVGDSLTERGRLAWYNPYDQYRITEIWDRQVGTGEQDLTQVLTLEYKPVDFVRVKDTINMVIDTTVLLIPPENSWNGIMRNIPEGTDLQNAQLLEMRVKGDVGILHIDLGKISEDINGDGMLNDEDKDGLRYLDDDEDTGYDGKFDAQEFGYDAVTNPDPSGDNYYYDDGNPYDIWGINGTEGNRPDGDIGYVPNTEDPDFNGLRKNNDYFSFRVDLSDDTLFEVPDTRNEGGWKTIRIPIREPLAMDTVVGEANWSEIWNARLWIDSASVSYADNNFNNSIKIEIASLELISTSWTDSLFIADSLRSGPVSFDVAVINTEVDNRYSPPPGVEGYYDPSREVTETEQSLLLQYKNLNARVIVNTPDSGLMLAADTGLAVRRNLANAYNLMGYGKIEAYVHGDDNVNEDVLFFFRLGYDKDSYYEYRTRLKPGWDPANHLLINFDEITGIKARLIEDRKNELTDSLVRIDETGKYLVKIKPSGSDPTLTRIQYYAMGVVNVDTNKTASGEVWIDELRLTDVRDDVGMAGRFSVNGNMADLITYSFSYSNQDAYYRGVSAATKGGAANNLGSGQTRTSYSFSGSLQLDKLFPRSLEMKLPLSVSWSQSVQEPLLRSGTDITVPEDLKDIETAVTVSKGFRVSESFAKKTNNIIYTGLLNRFSSRFNYNVTKGHSATQPMFFNERYDASATYDMSMRKAPSITPLKWMGMLKAPFGLPETRLYLYPTKLNFTGTFSGSYSKSYNQNKANPTSSKLDFRGTMNMSFKIFENLSGSYGFSTTRDLRDPKTVIFSLNPKTFKLGIEQNYSQNFRILYSPALFEFLTHKIDYSSSYSDSYRAGRDSTFYHSANSKNNISLNTTFKHQSLIGTNSRGKGVRRDTGSSFPLFKAFNTFLTGIRYITDAIAPVSASVGTGRTMSFPGLADKASIPFRLGFTDDPGVELVSTTTGVIRKSKSITKSFSASSGVKLFSGIGADVDYSWSTRETFENSPTKDTKETWPELQFNLRSIRGLGIIGRVINTLGPSSRFSRSKDTKRYTDKPFNSQESVRKAFAPLISFKIAPFRALVTSIRMETSNTETTQFTETTGEIKNITKKKSTGYSVNTTYSFRSPTGFKLPIFGRIKFESTMSVALDVSYKKDRDEAAKAPDYEFNVSSEKTNLTIRPTASYSFSSTVKGGLSARWQDSKDARTGQTRHTRELGFWVEMRF